MMCLLNVMNHRSSYLQYGMIKVTDLGVNWKKEEKFDHIGYSSHYIHTFSRKERRDRNRIQRDMEFHHSHPGSFTCPEYSSDTRDRHFTSPSVGRWWIRWIYTMKRWMMWESALCIESGFSAWEARRVTAWPPRLPYYALNVIIVNVLCYLKRQAS